MSQQQFFYDSILDALGADVAACGGHKIVAGKLWEDEAPEAATRKLRNCLNPDQAAKLDVTEILFIKRLARAHGSTVTIDYEAKQLGYEPTWIKPEDEAQRIHERAVAAMEELQRELSRSNELLAASRTSLRAVT